MQSNPIPLAASEDEEDYTPVFHSVSEERRAQDLAMYHQWNKTKSREDMGKLVNQLSPLIYKEVSRASGTLPTAALNAEAKKWTVKAIQTFEPERGFALATHVMNYLPKVRRLNYKYQNAVRLPENMQLQFHEYNKSLAQLSDELNRDPTEEEMAKHLGWSKAYVVKFKGSLYADLLEGASEKPAELSHYSDNSILFKHLLEQLTPQERMIWDLNKELSSTELAAKLGVNINRLNYLKNSLKNKVLKLKTELGVQ